jgi:hypothetical protein
MNKRGRGFVFGIIFLFLLVSLSSYFVFADSANNVQSYDSNTKTVTVSNSGSSVTNVYNTYVTNENNNYTNNNPLTSNNEDKNINKLGITGGVIGIINNLVSSRGQITFIITTLCITFIIFLLIRSSIIKIKRQ